jgi:purine-binding chemotaxis protein CheW
MEQEAGAELMDLEKRITAGKYLTFRLGAESYGIGILKVQEIIGVMAVTHVPRIPEFIRGVINLRGKVIPVLDLRLKFGLEGRPDTERTCIIVMQVARDEGHVTLGAIVDEVSEVLYIESAQIEPPPAFGGCVNTDFLLGMGKVGGKVIILLDVDKVMATDEIVHLKEVL